MLAIVIKVKGRTWFYQGNQNWTLAEELAKKVYSQRMATLLLQEAKRFSKNENMTKDAVTIVHVDDTCEKREGTFLTE